VVVALAGAVCALSIGTASAHTVSGPTGPTGPSAHSAHSAHHRSHSKRLIPPKALRVVKVSKSGFTVTAHAKARHFRLFAAKTKRQLAVAHIAHANKTRLRSTPTLTVKGLHYSTTDGYFYRLEAISGKRHRFSLTKGTVTLQPGIPTNLQVSSTLAGTSLSWNSGQATGFTITQATDAAMSQDVRTYTTENQDHQFAPANLEPGTTYFFQVSALNGTTVSPATSVVSAMARADQQPLSLMTYNIKKADLAGQQEGGNTVAPWSQRRARVAAMINGALPDVVTVQEAATLVAPDRRQVDSLVSALGGTYDLATTELPVSAPGNTRSGVYILYRPSVYSPVGMGGNFSLGDSRWAAYQVLKNKTSGAEFLVVTPHLQVTGGPGGTDQGREDEDKRMVSQASAYARSMGGVPVVYAGDFNSNPSRQHEFNGPSDYNLSVGLSDSFDVAQSRTNEQYNSANGYATTPPADGMRLDYVFTSPGIAVRSWALLLNLSHGKFVGGTPPSDHNPMLVNLLIPYQAVS
jgi:endonuclease/exonuclease/phosphatase family metal-dependent hydrolase